MSDLSTNPPMILEGDTNTPDMPLTESEVNHLRRLLAWMRCEWMLDENMQRGYIDGVSACIEYDIADKERIESMLVKKSEQMNQCPAYVRQSVKMLTKALAKHEKQSGIL